MIVHAARKFLRRPAADRRLLVHALVLHAGVATLLRLVRFGRLNRWLRTNQVGHFGRPEGLHDTSPVEPVEKIAVKRVVWAVHQATAVIPWGKTCLTEALTMLVMLRRAGCEPALRYGVASDEERGFAAHAWLELNGAVISRSPRAYAALRQAGRPS